jgi:ferredoxin
VDDPAQLAHGIILTFAYDSHPSYDLFFERKLVADKNDRWPLNVPGRWYVDRQCIDCDLCRTTAPENFQRSTDSYSYISRQPATPADEAACQQAADECPVNAIGRDG